MNAIVHATSGIAGDDNFIAGLQRRSRYTLTAQRSGPTPFDRPALQDALGIGSFNVNESVRIAEIELDDLARQFDFLGAVICGGNGMMRVRRHTQYQNSGN